jgi:thiamine biosynthesis lipoprotein
MGTFVTIQVVGTDVGMADKMDQDAAVERAFDWFRHIERCCTRFDPGSEIMQLTSRIGEPVRVSDLLYETVAFALAVADDTGGAFDPTIGLRMEQSGFNRDYRSGRLVDTRTESTAGVSYRDVRVDPVARTLTLARPLVLDLGGVAKGLAIDMAARELHEFRNYAIDAGGDLYLAGRSPSGERWRVGIRHPRMDDQLIDAISVSDAAVCTSGDYERRRAGGVHHILDPSTGTSATAAASVTVVASTAMAADALATGAFVLGPARGLALLEAQGCDGLFVLPTLERHATPGMSRLLDRGHGAAAAAC